MKKSIYFIFAIMMFFVSCTVDEDESELCGVDNPCSDGYTCNQTTGKCEKGQAQTDSDTEENLLPDSNEKNDSDAVEKVDKEKPDEDTDVVIKDCEPGELIKCDDGDFYKIIRCNSDGTGTESVFCGEMSVCEDNKCVQQMCEPSTPICSEEDPSKVFECNYLGTNPAEIPIENCGAGGFCQNGKCLFYCDIAANERSYQGCKYFTAFLNTQTQRSDPILAIVIANTNLEKVATINVTVSEDGVSEDDAGKCVYCDDKISATTCMLRTNSKDLFVQPGKIGIIQFPHDRMLVETGSSWKSYHIKSNLPVTIYQFSPLDNSDDNPFESNGKSKDWSFIDFLNNGKSFSNDASLLIPATSVYSNYRAVTWQSVMGSNAQNELVVWPSYITVIGIEDKEIELAITPTAPIVKGGDVPDIAADETFEFTLKKFQVYNFQTDDKKRDLTGSFIRCKDKDSKCGNFIVFSGNASTVLPIDKGYADHLEQQLFPIETWGKDYFLVKTKVKKDEYDYAKVIASEDDTTITYHPQIPELLSPYTTTPPKEKLNKGEWTEFYFKGSFQITADKPVMLAHFLTGADMISTECATGTHDYHKENCPGDPAMMLIPPSKQFRKDYIFLTPGSYKENFATVVVKNKTKAVLNDKELKELTEISGTEYSFKIVDLGSDFARHSLLCDEPCGLYVYGWESDVSYAYPGGLNLEKLTNN
ncbi:MAG: IgGFc-binding protein [bacterium]